MKTTFLVAALALLTLVMFGGALKRVAYVGDPGCSSIAVRDVGWLAGNCLAAAPTATPSGGTSVTLQQTNGGATTGATSVSAIYGAQPGTGDLDVAYVAFPATSTATAPSGWTLSFSVTSLTSKLAVYTHTAAAIDSKTVTFTFSASDYESLEIQDFANADTVSALQHADTTTTGTVVTTGAIAPTKPNSLPVGAFTQANNWVTTAGSGYAIPTNGQQAQTFHSIAVETAALDTASILASINYSVAPDSIAGSLIYISPSSVPTPTPTPIPHVVIVNRATCYGATATISCTLPATPAPGNKVVLIASGSPNNSAITGLANMALVTYNNATVNNDFGVWWKIATSGDGATATFSNPTTYDSGAELLEIQGSDANAPTVTGGNQAVSAFVMPSFNVGYQANGLVVSLFNPYLGATSYTAGSATVSGGFSIDAPETVSTSGTSSHSDFLWSHLSPISSGTTSESATFPNTITGTQTQVMVAFAPSPVSTPTATPTALASVQMAYERQAPAIANGTGINTSVSPSLAGPATAGDKLLLVLVGEANCSPTLTGITGWGAPLFCDTSGTPTQEAWSKTAASGDQTVTIPLNGSGASSQAILVDLANASASAPTFASAIENWSYANKTVVGPTVAGAAAGSYALASWNFNGLSAGYVPSGFLDQTQPWSVINENVTTQTGVGTANYMWGHLLNAPSGTLGTTYYAPSILNTVFSKGATPHSASELIVVAPGASLVAPPAVPTPAAVAALRADDLIGSMGINVHLVGGGVYRTYLSAPAPNGNTVISSLGTLGLRHIRDNEDYGSTPVCSTYTTLYGLGIDVIVTTDTGSTQANWTTEYNCVTNNGANPAALFAFEGWNEYNSPGDGAYNNGVSTGGTQPSGTTCTSALNPKCSASNWNSQLYQRQIDLFTARSASSNPTAAPFPHTVKIFAPPIIDATNPNDLNSLAGLYPGTFGTPLSSYVDAANMHLDNNGSNNPDSLGNISAATCYGHAGSMSNEYGWQSIIVGGAGCIPAKPVYITEFGWDDTITSYPSYIDNPTKAKYVMRAYLLGFQEGIARTYLYEMAREGSGYFGIMDNYLNPGPGFTATENLINILEDGTCAPSCAFTTTPLSYSVAYTQPDFEQLLLQKQDGSYWLVMWRSSESYDFTTNSNAPGHTDTVIPPDNVLVTFGAIPTGGLKLYTFDATTGAVTKTFPAGAISTTVAITDTPTILEILPPGITSTTPTLATPQPPVCPSLPNVLNCGTPGPTPTPTATPTVGPSPNSLQADSLVDSFGLNIHIGNSTGVWTYMSAAAPNGNTLIPTITALGVRHFRDSGTVAGQLNTTNCNADKTIIAAGNGADFDLYTSFGDTATTMAHARTCLGTDSAFHWIESPNEPELQSGHTSTYLADDDAAIKAMYNARTGGSLPAATQIIAPSVLTCGLYNQEFGYLSDDMATYVDDNNSHGYYAMNNPETGNATGTYSCVGYGTINGSYGSTTYLLNVSSIPAPGKPVIKTETGYSDTSGEPDGYGPSTTNNIDLPTETKYTLRTILDEYGILAYSFDYELGTDFNESFGLTDQYLNPKPSYVGLENFIKLMSDPGSAFTPGYLNYSLVSPPTDVVYKLFQKRDGSFWLTLWQNDKSWDINAHAPLTVTPANVTISFGATPTSLKLYSIAPSTGAVTTSTPALSTSVTVSVSDTPEVLEINGSTMSGFATLPTAVCPSGDLHGSTLCP